MAVSEYFNGKNLKASYVKNTHMNFKCLFNNISIFLVGCGFILSTNEASSQTYTYTGSLITDTITTSGVYNLTVAGAKGGNSTSISNSAGGLGALANGYYSFTSGTVLNIIVGGAGGNGTLGGGGGGGGSFIYTSSGNPIMISGGGGGGGYNAVGHPTCSGQLYDSSGNNGTNGNTGKGSEGGCGGASGNGGYASTQTGGGGGGAGFISGGSSSSGSNNGVSASSKTSYGNGAAAGGGNGGFGGGGGAGGGNSYFGGGGGGGYSGGGGGSRIGFGGGGGSYAVSGITNLSIIAGGADNSSYSNNGYVIISFPTISGTGSIYSASNLDSTVNPVFQGGTLQMNQANATYSQNFTVDTSTTNTIDQNGNTSTFIGVFSDVVAGQAGNIVISNSGNGGKIIFTGANTFSGTTTITNGADVAVNGSMASSFIVNSGGILQGNGSFTGGSINSGGIIAPGNSIGTITSNGALTFAQGSTYQVEVNSAGQSDKTVVSGAAATINGGKVNLVSYDNNPSGIVNKKFSILTASSGVTGKFDSISANFSFLTPTLYYGSADVALGVEFTTPFSTVAKNINQRNVGNALTIAALGPVNSLGAPILNALFYGNYQNAQAVMDTVGGSGLAGVQSAAMQVGEMASSSVSDQIAFWRSGETIDATGRTSQEGNNPRNFLAYAPTETKVPAKGPINLKRPAGSLTAALAPRTFRAWGSMFGGGANYLSDAGRGAAASNIGYYGGLIGVDYQVQPNILVGVAVGGSSSNFNVGSLSTNGNLTGFHASVYGAYTMENSYIALNETFSAYNNQTSRKAGGYAYLPYEQLSAQFGSTEFRTRGELGHGVLMGGLKATPFVAAEIAAYQSNAFSEQSSIYASTFALKNNGQGVNSLPTFAGLRLSNAVTLSNGWRLAPVGSVAYVHEFYPQRQFNNMLISMPSSDFNVAGPRSTYNLVQTKVGAQLNLSEKLALFTDFQGEFSPVSQSYGGKGGVKYVW